MSDLETIMSMLSYRRPFHSPTEQQFIEKFISPLDVAKDQFGNLFKVIGDKSPTVLWSSHTDSVHSKEGLQKVQFDGSKFIHLPTKSSSNCLGADCAAGVWIMMEMIKAKVPGLYVFHYAEEVGCVGSSGIAKDNPQFLDGIKSAIAFDRRGDNSLITHQGSRGCSDAFGYSMMEQLPSRFKLDPTGVLTDTKMYMKIVPECTNISVGYYHEHTPDEKLDVGHLIELRNHMVKIDTSKFTIERDPTIVTMPRTKHYGSLGGRSLRRLLPRDVEDLVWTYPRLVAQFLEENAVSFEELDDYIQSGGYSNLFDNPDQGLLIA